MTRRATNRRKAIPSVAAPVRVTTAWPNGCMIANSGELRHAKTPVKDVLPGPLTARDGSEWRPLATFLATPVKIKV